MKIIKVLESVHISLLQIKDVYPKFIIALHPSFPDCQPSFLSADEHRSIFDDCYYLGVPSIVLQIHSSP